MVQLVLSVDVNLPLARHLCKLAHPLDLVRPSVASAMDVVGTHIHGDEQGVAGDGGHERSGRAGGAIREQRDRRRERELLRVGEQVVQIVDEDTS